MIRIHCVQSIVDVEKTEELNTEHIININNPAKETQSNVGD